MVAGSEGYGASLRHLILSALAPLRLGVKQSHAKAKAQSKSRRQHRNRKITARRLRNYHLSAFAQSIAPAKRGVCGDFRFSVCVINRKFD